MSTSPEDASPASAPPEPPASASLQMLPGPQLRQLWWRVLLRTALLTAAGALAGVMFFADALPGITLALFFALLFQLRNLVQLRAWLDRPKHREPPDSSGLWGEVVDRLLDIQRKNRKRKKRLTAILSEFQASTAALPDGAVVLGERGEISWFNAAAKNLLALRAPQDVGIRIANLIRNPQFADYLSQADFDQEVEVPSPVNRNRTLTLRVIPYGNQQKLMIVRDVSQRHRLDAARRDFVSNASHELRTPLTVLRGYLDIMDMDAQGADAPLGPWRVPLTEMRNQTLRMEALVNDMLKLARLEADRPSGRDQVLDVPQLLSRAVEEAKAVSGGQHRFELDVDADLLLTGAETSLHSVLVNLITNAVRYTPTNGVIRVSWQARDDGARFSVTDTGIGIAAHDLPRLTERFYRVDVGRSRDSGGTGLGLSIVKHALQSFDAQLDIQSELGVGSTFSCDFPVHRVLRRDAQP